jgi:parvulin-like peptidyl-prolyl isomerase
MRKYSNRQQKKKRYALSTLIAGVIFLMIVFGILLVFAANGKIRRVHADETSTISAQQTRMQSMLDQVVAQPITLLLRQRCPNPAQLNAIPRVA